MNSETGIASPVPLQQQEAFPATRLLIFCGGTVLLSVGILLALPAQLGPVLVVFIPAILAAGLAASEAGFRGIGPALFPGGFWRISLKGALAASALALALRGSVSLLALALGYSFRPQGFTPLLVIVFLFAAGEEIGWRGYALPRMLRRYSPLASALLLEVPWALLHVPLTLPGQMLAGVPVPAVLLVMMSLSVLTAACYLGAARAVLAPIILHGGQNFLVFLNNGVPVDPINWCMAAVYGVAALAMIAATRGKLFADRGQ